MKLGEEPRGRGRREEGQGVWRGGGCRTFQVGLEVAVGLATRPKKFVAGYQGPTKVVEAGLGAPALSEQNNTPAHKPHIRSSQGGFGGGEGGGGAGRGATHLGGG